LATEQQLNTSDCYSQFQQNWYHTLGPIMHVLLFPDNTIQAVLFRHKASIIQSRSSELFSRDLPFCLFGPIWKKKPFLWGWNVHIHQASWCMNHSGAANEPTKHTHIHMTKFPQTSYHIKGNLKCTKCIKTIF
jgi:hypothetical protein